MTDERSAKDTAHEPTRDDVLVRALRELPAHSAPSQRDAARAAFVRAFDDLPWYRRALGAVSRATVPVVLASVVGIYLFWAFATVIALTQ